MSTPQAPIHYITLHYVLMERVVKNKKMCENQVSSRDQDGERVSLTKLGLPKVSDDAV